MLANLAYIKLLKSLPEDTLSSVNSQLVLLAAAGALGKSQSEPSEILGSSDIISPTELFNQKGLLDCISSSVASEPAPRTSPSPSTPPATVTTTSSRSPVAKSDTNHTSPGQVKEEPQSPTSPKASFRPLVPKSTTAVTSSSSHLSTVHWGSSGPPPNKTCTSTTTTSIAKLHPCDTSIINLLSPYKTSVNVETRLQKFCLRGDSTSSTAPSTLTNINWSSANAAAPTRTYNCYWMSHVGPCNRQFLDKDDLYKHLKSHVNDLEALTPVTAVLQPLNPPCNGCDKNRNLKFTKVHGRYQPYSKCSKFSRCACRR